MYDTKKRKIMDMDMDFEMELWALKQVLSLPPNAPNHDEQLDRTSGLSLEKCLSFGCFDSRYVLFWG